MILIKHLQINQILALNNPWGVSMSLKKDKKKQIQVNPGWF